MSDLVERRDAICAVGLLPKWFGKDGRLFLNCEDVINALIDTKKLPSVEVIDRAKLFLEIEHE